MYKKIFAAFFVGVFCIDTFCQDYVAYQKSVTEAEQHILDSNYQQSLNIYDSLFKAYDFVFAKHCYTALQLVAVVGDESKMIPLLQKAIEQGITQEDITYSPLMNRMTEKPWWDSFITLQYDSLRSVYLNNINLELRDRVLWLFSVDQYLTQRSNHSRFIKHLFLTKKWVKGIRKNVEENLKPLIDKFGFPGEKLIGIANLGSATETDSIGRKVHRNVLEQGHGYFDQIAGQFMLIHYFSRANPTFNELLLDEIKKGNMDPSQFAAICDFQTEYGEGDGYYNQWHRDTDSTVRAEINERRLQLGLETYEVLRIKEKRNWQIRKMIKAGNYDHIKLWTVWGSY